MLQLGINHCSNADYHADNKFLSSSNLKTLLKDPEAFYKQKILGEREERKESSAFEEGSLTHSLILEPQLVASEYAYFDGLRKAGADYERFAAQNAGKTIVSKPMKIRTDLYKKAYLGCPPAVELIKGGDSEHTICVDFNGIPIKVRCDYINVDKGYIVDVKTSSYPVDVDSFRMTIGKWGYDLSAALYVEVAELYYGKPFKFYFIPIAKTNPPVCDVFIASQKTLDKGRQEILKAMGIYKKCMASGIWKLEDKIQQADVSSKHEILEV